MKNVVNVKEVDGIKFYKPQDILTEEDLQEILNYELELRSYDYRGEVLGDLFRCLTYKQIVWDIRDDKDKEFSNLHKNIKVVEAGGKFMAEITLDKEQAIERCFDDINDMLTNIPNPNDADAVEAYNQYKENLETKYCMLLDNNACENLHKLIEEYTVTFVTEQVEESDLVDGCIIKYVRPSYTIYSPDNNEEFADKLIQTFFDYINNEIPENVYNNELEQLSNYIYTKEPELKYTTTNELIDWLNKNNVLISWNKQWFIQNY